MKIVHEIEIAFADTRKQELSGKIVEKLLVQRFLFYVKEKSHRLIL